MRLATFTDETSTRIGVVTGEHILDLAQVAPELPTDMRLLLDGGKAAMDRVRAVAQERATIALADVRLEPPVPAPRKFLALAMNYHMLVPWPDMKQADFEAQQAKQRQQKADNHQWWYNKQVTAITGPSDPIHLPPHGKEEVYFEVELAFVIGQRCRDVSREEAASVIAGYMVCNDVTQGDWCRAAMTLSMGKSYDTFGPQGPWIMTPDELGDPHRLQLTGTVNGELWESGSTSDMVFDCYDLVSWASRRFTLEPGDVVTTGMPAVPMKPLSDGDVVRCEIEGLGHIENRVTDAPLPALS